MNVLFVVPESLRPIAVHLFAAVTGQVGNLGCLTQLCWSKEGCRYSVVSISDVYFDAAKLNSSIVRPASDTLELIDIEKANLASLRLSRSIVGSDLITVLCCESGLDAVVLEEYGLSIAAPGV